MAARRSKKDEVEGEQSVYGRGELFPDGKYGGVEAGREPKGAKNPGNGMKVEASNGAEGKRVGAKRNGERLVRKQGCSRRTRRRVHAASTAIQRLFVACKSVFKGPGTVPEPADVEMLQLLLGIVSEPPASVTLRESEP
ncbi:hypothetical protein GW17_00022726 [Ensete ventricosum]|nr:hypothetical protein GW17_00022726 [Ensete ventricosum]